MATLEAELKAFGTAIGLDLIGVAAAHPFVAERTFLQERVARGLGPHPFEHADIEPRVQPEWLLPGVRSIVSAGVSYLMPDPPETEALSGWFSRYCRGLDYHLFLEERLQQVAAFLQQHHPGAQTCVYVDTGPPLDRAMAERAGLGKMGKNTNVIAPRLGSWIFLGEVLTDVVLTPDEPLGGSICGSCTLCIDACPTGCLTPWSIDPFRCLGYVNQETGPMAPEYRERMGARLFGCDDCQDVCPHNVSARRGLHPEFAGRPEPGDLPDLLKVLRMTEAEFDTWMGPTAAAWQGRLVLQRNAVVALGNSGRHDALAPLLETLDHPEPLLRSHAAWALGRLARLRPELMTIVRQALSAHAETADEVTQEVEAALHSLKGDVPC